MSATPKLPPPLPQQPHAADTAPPKQPLEAPRVASLSTATRAADEEPVLEAEPIEAIEPAGPDATPAPPAGQRDEASSTATSARLREELATAIQLARQRYQSTSARPATPERKEVAGPPKSPTAPKSPPEPAVLVGAAKPQAKEAAPPPQDEPSTSDPSPVGAQAAPAAAVAEPGTLPQEPKRPSQPTATEPKAAPPARDRRSSTAIPWLAAAVAAILAVGGLAAFLSARADLSTERAALAETLVTVGSLRADNATLQERIDGLEVDREKLAEEARIKAEALAAMQATQDELQQRLQAEVKKGSVLISQQQGELVVDLIDQVVFDSGEAELNDQGKAVLRQVGETLARVPNKIIQVSGHTDHLRIAGKLEEQFPTNWELSTARATQVVRYLQDELKIPGKRLVAAGLAEFRPIARNTTRAGRSKNRRIEVRLLPLPAR